MEWRYTIIRVEFSWSRYSSFREKFPDCTWHWSWIRDNAVRSSSRRCLYNGLPVSNVCTASFWNSIVQFWLKTRVWMRLKTNGYSKKYVRSHTLKTFLTFHYILKTIWPLIRGKRHTAFVPFNIMKHSNFNFKFGMKFVKILVIYKTQLQTIRNAIIFLASTWMQFIWPCYWFFMNELSVESQETMNHSKTNLKDACKSMSRNLQTNPPTVTMNCAS